MLCLLVIRMSTCNLRVPKGKAELSQDIFTLFGVAGQLMYNGISTNDGIFIFDRLKMNQFIWIHYYTR